MPCEVSARYVAAPQGFFFYSNAFCKIIPQAFIRTHFIKLFREVLFGRIL